MRELIEELRRRQADSLKLGGAGRVERQRHQGKLTARERVDLLLDDGSFEELGQLASHVHTPVPTIPDKTTPADGVVTGFGRIEGRPAAAIAEDFTVLGGSLGINNFTKKVRMMELSGRDKVPIVWLFDGAGARTDEYIGEGLAPMHHFMDVAKLSGVTPQIAGVMGPSAGDSSLLAAMMEFIVMVEGTSMLAAGGPPLVKVGTGEEVSKEELGGADLHCRVSGVGDNTAPDDAAAIAMLRRYLSYLPTNAYQYPPYREPDDDPDRRDEELGDILPDNLRRPYDMKKILERVVDRDSFFEIKPDFAKMMIVGLARLNGHAIGVIANQPKVMAGAITAAAGAKHRHFMDLCNAYHLPILFLMDTPGVMTGPQSEREGALRAGMTIAHSFAFARVPLLTLTVHKGFGYGAAAMGGMGAGQSATLAWPTADFNAIPLESGIQAAYRAVLEAADDPVEVARQLEEELGALCGSFPAAEQMKIDDIIDPAESRPRLIQALERALARRARHPEPATRHGFLP
ncbi:MAG: carboxyl transferase domain-containing protein [Alphaproteobacteria bacterium]|jgi:acetyl-CoA carboxylase carboxyltransferase component|nr:carboxyl transferase domain-containing protein [Alphaproteobacteria bacterium]